MAFSGYEFIFDGIPSMKYDLMLYNIGSYKQNESVEFTSAGKLIEDRIANRYSSLLYGTEHNAPLTFDLIFGASPDRMSRNEPFDSFEIEAISSWLTGHNTWKWLKIVQPDLENVRFKCLITELKQISYGNISWAFSCTVTCDSPYAYRSTTEYEYSCWDSETTDILFRNRSSCNDLYCPIMEITLNGPADIKLVNHSDQNREFCFSALPASVHKIVVDNENQIITNDTDLNIYPNFNFGYLRLVRGDNHLTLTGNCTVKFICDFPVNVGG